MCIWRDHKNPVDATTLSGTGAGWVEGGSGAGDKGQRFVVQLTAGATAYAQSIWVRSERRTVDTIVVVIAPLRDSECM